MFSACPLGKGAGPALPAGASEADIDAAALGRTLRQWLTLQDTLNALYDSASADNPTGINVRAISRDRVQP